MLLIELEHIMLLINVEYSFKLFDCYSTCNNLSLKHPNLVLMNK